MGTYLNPGNSGFKRIRNGKYVDKTGMLSLINDRIGTPENLICISRPRRFGKSYAAQMLCAYYDKSCDSSGLFKGLEISGDETYKEHLNKYDVMYVDMTGVKPDTQNYTTLVSFVSRNIKKELYEAYPEAEIEDEDSFINSLVKAVRFSERKFIMLIDEWDAPIRENPKIGREYLEFLRSLFKNSGTTSKIFAAAYMTGILPIKKDGSQSAISEFNEFTMLKPGKFATYVGFTEAEVKGLCEESGVSFIEMKKWYDGYTLRNVGSVYNPNSVMKAIENEDFDSYWTETSAAEGLMDYIRKDYNGMTKTIAELIGGVNVPVNPVGFANDLITFKGRDDVLTLMIHLGYLTYNSETGKARIPNEEIRQEFQRAVRLVDHSETAKRLKESDQLFLDTINLNEEAVAAQIEKIHREETSPLFYNREEDLRSVIKLAYYTYRDHYLKFEELPSGNGYADIVYLPKQGEGLPALVIELKYNKSAEGAIDQILNKQYPDAVKDYGGEVLLVGINYDKDTREHSCRIQKYQIYSKDIEFCT